MPIAVDFHLKFGDAGAANAVKKAKKGDAATLRAASPWITPGKMSFRVDLRLLLGL